MQTIKDIKDYLSKYPDDMEIRFSIGITDWLFWSFDYKTNVFKKDKKKTIVLVDLAKSNS